MPPNNTRFVGELPLLGLRRTEILTDSTPVKLAEAIEANLATVLRMVGQLPDVELHDDGDAVWICSSTPGRNNDVVMIRFKGDTADERIERILDWYRQRHVACSWWVGPNTIPSDLQVRLRQHG